MLHETWTRPAEPITKLTRRGHEVRLVPAKAFRLEARQKLALGLGYLWEGKMEVRRTNPKRRGWIKLVVKDKSNSFYWTAPDVFWCKMKVHEALGMAWAPATELQVGEKVWVRCT